MMSYADIDDGTGKTRRVCLDEVDRVTECVEFKLQFAKRQDLSKACLEATTMLIESDMDAYQLKWLASILIQNLFSHERTVRYQTTRRHRDHLNQMLAVRDMALGAEPPADIWPELDD